MSRITIRSIKITNDGFISLSFLNMKNLYIRISIDRQFSFCCMSTFIQNIIFATYDTFLQQRSVSSCIQSRVFNFFLNTHIDVRHCFVLEILCIYKINDFS